MHKILITLLLTFATFIPASTSFSQNYQQVFNKEPPKDFDQYVEGALKVYSQFRTPSKESSEDFYKFVKHKWSDSNCSIKCSEDGYKVAKEYVEKNKIAVKPEK